MRSSDMPTISSNGPNNDGWMAAAMRNPVLNRAIRASPFNRSNSHPVHEVHEVHESDNTSGPGGDVVGRGRRSTTDNLTNPRHRQASTVILMEEGEEAEPGTSNNQRASQRGRRRLSASASTPPNNSNTAIESAEIGLNQIVPELSHLASSLLRGASNVATTERGVQHAGEARPSRYSLTIRFGQDGEENAVSAHAGQRAARTTSIGTQTRRSEGGDGYEEEYEEVTVQGDDGEATPTGLSSNGEASGGEEPSSVNNSNANVTGDLPHLRALLRNREALMRSLWHSLFEFPNLHGVGVLLTALVVVATLTVKFLIHHFAACLALVLALFHYQDAARFQRCLSGVGEIYFPIANILTRNFVILYVLNMDFVIPIATFQQELIPLPAQRPGFFSILFRVIVAEMCIMDAVLMCKILVSKFPTLSKAHKRRIFQWLEYSSILYRFPIPFIQWTNYLHGLVWSMAYIVVKLLLGVSILWTWLRTTVRLFFCSHLGTVPTEEEVKKAENCTICFGDFTSPLKLSCGHVYCSDCIRTWLDREVTCPVCRATVTKEDNHYRRGNTTFPMHMF